MKNVIYIDFVNKRRLEAPSEPLPKLSANLEAVKSRLQDIRNEAGRLYNAGHSLDSDEVNKLIDESILLAQMIARGHS